MVIDPTGTTTVLNAEPLSLDECVAMIKALDRHVPYMLIPGAVKCSDGGFIQGDPLLSLAEAGRMIGKSSATIKSWILKGHMRAVADPSGRLRVRLSELGRYYGPSQATQGENADKSRDNQ